MDSNKKLRYALQTFGAETVWNDMDSIAWSSSRKDAEAARKGEEQKNAPPAMEEAGREVEYTDYPHNDVETTRQMAEALGMTEGKSEEYPSFYAVGSSVEIGINTANPYRIIHNYGNRNFTAFGAQIGMDRETCRKKLAQSDETYASEVYEDGRECDVIYWAEYGHFSLIYGEDGTLEEWEEHLSYNSPE